MKLNCELHSRAIHRKQDSTHHDVAFLEGVLLPPVEKKTKQNIYEEKCNLLAFMANWQTDKYKKYL